MKKMSRGTDEIFRFTKGDERKNTCRRFIALIAVNSHAWRSVQKELLNHAFLLLFAADGGGVVTQLGTIVTELEWLPPSINTHVVSSGRY